MVRQAKKNYLIILILSIISFTTRADNPFTLNQTELLAFNDLQETLTLIEREYEDKNQIENWTNDPRLIGAMAVFLSSETLFSIGFNLQSSKKEFFIKHLKKIGGPKYVGRSLIGLGVIGMISSGVYIFINDLVFPEKVEPATITEYYMTEDGIAEYLKLILYSPKTAKYYMSLDKNFADFIIKFSDNFIRLHNKITIVTKRISSAN